MLSFSQPVNFFVFMDQCQNNSYLYNVLLLMINELYLPSNENDQLLQDYQTQVDVSRTKWR